jgi:hypothetical protein
MSIGAEFHTKEGNIFIADVMDQKIMKIDAKGIKSQWTPYKSITGGEVGKTLVMELTTRTVETSEIVKIAFPQLEELHPRLF